MDNYKNLFSKHYIIPIKLFFEWIKQKRFLFIMSLTSFVLFFTSTLMFNREPFSDINVVIAIVFFISAFAFYISRNKTFFMPFIVFWFVFLFIVTILNIFNASHPFTVVANVMAIVSAFIFVYSTNNDERTVIIRMVYYLFAIYIIWFFARYAPEWFVTKKLPGLDEYFGNLDGATNRITIGLLFACFYLYKKDYISILIILISVFLIFIGERRTAVLYLLIVLFCLLYMCFEHKLLMFWISTLSLILLIILSIFLFPDLSGVAERFLHSISGLFGGETDGSTYNRINMVLSGNYYAFTNLFRALGYGTASDLFSTQISHDSMGDLAYPYGGFIAIIVNAVFFHKAFKMIQCNGEYKYFYLFAGFAWFITFFVGRVLQSRVYCIFIGMVYALFYLDSLTKKNQIIVNPCNAFFKEIEV